MNLHSHNKLNKLWRSWKPSFVATTKWLEEQGIYRQLRRDYVSHNWLETFGYGAFFRAEDTVHWQGALSALQTQLRKSIHLGARSALEYQGLAHYIRTEEQPPTLFYPMGENIPKWFTHYNWKPKLKLIRTSFLPKNLGLENEVVNGFPLIISSPERAILEACYLANIVLSLDEVYHLTENLRLLRPKLLQSLLDNCNSIKVKRIFLCMATRSALPCMKNLNLKSIDLGSGKRHLSKNGFYDKTYKITLPHSIENDSEYNL